MLFEPLFAHAASRPNEVAVIDDRGQATYQQLATTAAGLGMYLAARTTKPRVGLLLPSSSGFVASFYATLLAGKSAVPINFLLGDREIAHIVSDSGIDTVITIPLLAGRVKDLPGINVIDLTQLPQPPAPAPGVAPTTPATPKFPQPKPEEEAVLLYTSGTSGLPKGVILTYDNFQSDVDASIKHVGLLSSHVFLGVIPMFHSFGIMAMMLAPMQLGAKIVYLARFSAVGVIKAIREHGVSIMMGVPSMYGAMLRLKDAGPGDFAKMYAIISGAEPLPESIREAFLKRFGKPIFEGYGLTETSPAVNFNTPLAHRPGSVGKSVPGAEVKIADENGNAVAVGETGEVWLKGPMIMQGYWNLPKETAEALTSDRYFKTGDLGKVDAEGYLYITGRKKDMIIVAGEKAFPREIEDALMRHPSVADAAVVGKKDPSRGEVVVAFVTSKEGQTAIAEELKDHCRKEGLPQWKVPRDVHVVEDLPRSPTGKVLKRELAAKVNEANG
jgi:long-chain acyl-CoA synthetase